MAETLDELMETAKDTTYYAEATASLIVDEYDLPPTSFVPDGEGGIDIEWERGDKEVSISCRATPEQEAYLYYRQGTGEDALRMFVDPSPDNLKDRLQWLMRDGE